MCLNQLILPLLPTAVGVGEKRKAESSQKRGSAAKKPRGAYSAGQRGSRGRGAGQRGSRGASRMSRWTPAGGEIVCQLFLLLLLFCVFVCLSELLGP